jgi:hypothetical protein
VTTVDEIERAGPLRRGATVWYAAFGGVAAWTVHLVFEAAIVRWTADVRGWDWVLHAATVVCAGATVVAMLLSWRLRAAAGAADESASDDAGQLLFLGNLGLLVGAINLALIILEGIYAAVLYQPHTLR